MLQIFVWGNWTVAIFIHGEFSLPNLANYHFLLSCSVICIVSWQGSTANIPHSLLSRVQKPTRFLWADPSTGQMWRLQRKKHILTFPLPTMLPGPSWGMELGCSLEGTDALWAASPFIGLICMLCGAFSYFPIPCILSPNLRSHLHGDL